MMATSPIIAGIEFHTADLVPVFVLLGLVIVAHLVGLPLVIWGHFRLYRSKRPKHLFYVLPLSWYFISSGCLVLGMICQDRWSRWTWNQDYVAQYLVCLVAVVLMSAHGLWVARLLRRAEGPVLCSWVLVSASLILLLPPLGLVLALVALRRIRRSEGRLFGRGGAWASFASNVGMSLWLSVAVICNWSEWFGSSGAAGKIGPGPVLTSPLITTSSTVRPLAIAITNAAKAATAPETNGSLAPVPATPAREDPAWFGSGPFSGHWIAQFNFERNTRNPVEPPHPWETFSLTLTQEVHAVRGQMRGMNYRVTGRLSGIETDGRFQGVLRFSWDTHDWEEFTLTLNEDRTRATGRAVFHANPQEQHYYKVELRPQR